MSFLTLLFKNVILLLVLRKINNLSAVWFLQYWAVWFQKIYWKECNEIKSYLIDSKTERNLGWMIQNQRKTVMEINHFHAGILYTIFKKYAEGFFKSSLLVSIIRTYGHLMQLFAKYYIVKNTCRMVLLYIFPDKLRRFRYKFMISAI